MSVDFGGREQTLGTQKTQAPRYDRLPARVVVLSALSTLSRCARLPHAALQQQRRANRVRLFQQPY